MKQHIRKHSKVIGLLAILATIILVSRYAAWHQQVEWNTPEELWDQNIYMYLDKQLQIGMFSDGETIQHDIVIGFGERLDLEESRDRGLDFSEYERIERPGLDVNIQWSEQATSFSFIGYETEEGHGFNTLYTYSFGTKEVVQIPDSSYVEHHWWNGNREVVFTTQDGIVKIFNTETGETQRIGTFDGDIVWVQPFRSGMMVHSLTLNENGAWQTELFFGNFTDYQFVRIDENAELPFVYIFADESVTLHEDVPAYAEPGQLYTYEGYIFVEMCEGPQDLYCQFWIGDLDGSRMIEAIDIELEERYPFFELARRLYNSMDALWGS